jgi:hypothetical protein
MFELGAEDMNSRGQSNKVFWMLVFVLLTSVSGVQAQNVYGDLDQVKRELGDLRNQVQNLRDTVSGLKKAILESATRQPQQVPEKAPVKEEKAPPRGEKGLQSEASLDDAQLTRVICRSVGKFFGEAEAILRANASSSAEEKMNQAFQNMNSELREYRNAHRVKKLLDIYESLAWDTYVAVNLRHSVQGSEEFAVVLQKHKRKYMETCPQD